MQKAALRGCGTVNSNSGAEKQAQNHKTMPRTLAPHTKNHLQHLAKAHWQGNGPPTLCCSCVVWQLLTEAGVSDQTVRACLILCQNTILRDHLLSETQSLILLSGHRRRELNHTLMGLFILWDHVRAPCSYQVYPWISFAPSPQVRILDKKTSMCGYLDLQTPAVTFPFSV